MRTDLGTLGGTSSKALAINNRGQIVGWALNGNGIAEAFIWLPGVGTMLNPAVFLSNSDQANWHLKYATGINDDGTIVGVGRQTGVSYDVGFVLQPKL